MLANISRGTVRVRDCVNILLRDGFSMVRQSGSHRVFARGTCRVVISWRDRETVGVAAIRQILRPAGLV